MSECLPTCVLLFLCIFKGHITGANSNNTVVVRKKTSEFTSFA